MLKQFTAYMLSFLMVNHLAYPPEARAAEVARNDQTKQADQKNTFRVLINKPVSYETSEGNLQGYQFQDSQGNDRHIVWSTNPAENQGYYFQSEETVDRNMEALRKQAMANRRAAKKQARAEAKEDAALMKELREFQGQMMQALQIVHQSSNVYRESVKGRTAEKPDKVKKPKEEAPKINYVRNYRQLKKQKQSKTPEERQTDKAVRKEEVNANRAAQKAAEEKRASDERIRENAKHTQSTLGFQTDPKAEFGITEADAKKHQQAFANLLVNMQNSLLRYNELHNGKIEGALLDGMQQLIDETIDRETKKPKSEKRLAVVDFLKKTSDVMNNSAWLTMMQFRMSKMDRSDSGQFFLMRELHNDLMRFQLEQKRFGTVAKESARLGKFARDTFLFSIAIGAVMAQQLWVDYGANPVSMQQHLESMKDPLGNLSFYGFIVANGISAHYLTLNATKKQQHALRTKALRMVPYLSMTAGSLTSNLITDLGTVFKACWSGLYNAKSEKGADPYTLSACDEALRQWTVSGKINQYVPTIMSMLLSNKVAAVIETNVRSGIAHTSHSMSKFVNTQSAFGVGQIDDTVLMAKSKGFLAGTSLDTDTKLVRAATANATFTTTAESLMSKGANMGKGVLKFIGANVGLVFQGGTFYVSGVRLLFMVVQFAGFTFLDHLIMPNIMLGWSNLVIAHTQFPYLSRKMNIALKWATVNGFMGNDITKDYRKNAGWFGDDMPIATCEVSPLECDQLPDLVLDWRDFFTKWRADQNAKFETAFMGWGESLKNVTNQYGTSRAYYTTLLTNYFDDLRERYLMSIDAQKAAGIENVTFLSEQTYPLFGVVHESMYLEPDDLDGASTPEEARQKAWNMHREAPNGLQKRQLKAVNTTIAEFDKTIDLKKLWEESDRKRYIEIRDALMSTDVMTVSRGLVKLRQAAYGADRMKQPDFAIKMQEYYKKLGEPSPILTPTMGHAYTFGKNSTYKNDVANFSVPWTPSGYWFEKPTDFLTYQMICGEDDPKLRQFTGFSANFLAPGITNLTRTEKYYICQAQQNAHMKPGVNAWVENYMKTYQMKNGEKVNGLFQYILRNLKPGIIPDYKNEKVQNTLVGDWWDNLTLKPMTEFYANQTVSWDPIYRELVVRMNQKDAKTPWFFNGEPLVNPTFSEFFNLFTISSWSGLKDSWNKFSWNPYDKGFGDAVKTTLRTLKFNDSISYNLVSALKQEIGLYNTILRGLVSRHRTDIGESLGLKSNLDPNFKPKTFAEGVLGDNESLSKRYEVMGQIVMAKSEAEQQAGQPADAVAAIESFIKLVDENIAHLARAKVTPDGPVTGAPTRSEMREMMQKLSEVHSAIKQLIPKFMMNEYQTKLFQNVMIGYANALNDVNKYRMAANLTNYDRREDQKDLEMEMNMVEQMKKLYQMQRAGGGRAGSNVRGSGG